MKDPMPEGRLGTRMAELSRQLDICAPLLEGELVLLDYPVHENVGDLLIWHGEKAFLKRHGKRPIAQFSIDNIGGRAHSLLDRCSTICMHGGGNFGDLWPGYQKVRERIIQQFPRKRIVIFPQTVHFTDAEELDRASDIARAHPDLHIFLRDRTSFSLLQARGVPNLALCPDMAHALWGRLKSPRPTLSAPLHLLRRDKEGGELPPAVAATAGTAVDWSDLLTGRMDLAYRFGVGVTKLDGRRRLSNRLPAYSIWSRVSEMLVDRAIGLLSPHRTIVTNRLHAVILTCLLGREAVAIDNSYGKVSSYVSLWLDDVVGTGVAAQASLSGR